jgi:hypothetical protein
LLLTFTFYFEKPLWGLVGIFTQKAALVFFLKSRFGIFFEKPPWVFSSERPKLNPLALI